MKRILFALLVICFLAPVSRVQKDLEYQSPPDRLVRIVDAAPTPSVSISHDGSWMLIMESREGK